jgi:phosphopantetheinyl transferase (holo-ACP synthase)
VNPQDFADYLSRLLGRPVAMDEWIRLRSGQQARVAGWLTERGLAVDGIRVALNAPFQPQALLGDPLSTQPIAASTATARVDDAPSGLRVGVDIQRVDEIMPADGVADLKASSELAAMFTLRELSYAQSRPDPLETLCGIFAAKEAIRKCDPALLALPLVTLEVLPDAAGQPAFAGFALSISHSGGYAVAVAAALSPKLLGPAKWTVDAPSAAPPAVPNASLLTKFLRIAIAPAVLVILLLIMHLIGILRLWP